MIRSLWKKKITGVLVVFHHSVFGVHTKFLEKFISKVENKIDEYKKENPGIFSWEIRDRLVKVLIKMMRKMLSCKVVVNF